MEKTTKILSIAIVSSALLTTVAVGLTGNANNVNNTNNVDMQLGINANEDGKSAKLSVHNVSMTSAFDLSIKIEGDVEFKNIEFTDYIKQNAITKVNYNESSKILNIVVTSNVDLAKGGILEVGTIIVDGANDVEYKIFDNSVSGHPSIRMVTPTYDEISDKDLEEIGDTTITIGNVIQTPPIDEVPPTDGGGNEKPPANEEEKPQEPPTNEDTGAPSEDIEITEGKDGYKLVIPKTKEALDTVIKAILEKDSSAKIVDIKEDSLYYIYRVKYKKIVKTDSEYDYIDIKVSKVISDKEGLPGIDIEDSNNQNQGSGTTKPGNGNDNTGSGNNNTGSGNNNSNSGSGNSNSGSSNENNNSSTGNTGSSNNENVERPQTGDESVGAMIIMALASIGGLIFINKKKNKEVNK